MKLSLFIYDLGCGGAQRVMTTVANGLAGRGHAVTLYTLSSGDPFFPVNPEVQVNCLGGITPEGSGRAARAAAFLARIRLIRRAIVRDNPDAALSFISEMNVMTLLAVIGTGVPVAVSERSYPPMMKVSPLYSTLRRLFYPAAAAVVVQTKVAAEWARPWLRKGKVHVLPNPVSRPAVGVRAVDEDWPAGRKIIFSMGRLSREKGFDLLIEAFSMIGEKHREWVLLILGEGGEEEMLAKMAKEKDCEGRVFVRPARKDVGALLKAAALYALPSRFEGFPNALCEAMAAGVPVVAFDCPAGPGEIVRDGVDGLLVNPGDIRGLADSLDRLMSDSGLRDELSRNAVAVAERFSSSKIVERWEGLLAGISRRGTPS